jgi:hypothetical protein
LGISPAPLSVHDTQRIGTNVLRVKQFTGVGLNKPSRLPPQSFQYIAPDVSIRVRGAHLKEHRVRMAHDDRTVRARVSEWRAGP